MNRKSLFSAVLLFVVTAFTLMACQPIQAPPETIQFDVAEDMNRFIFDQDVVYSAQTLLGFNASQGVNLRVQLNVQK